MRLRILAPLALALTGVIPATSALAQWSPVGTSVCTALLDQTVPRSVSDGVGGVLIAWTDLRNAGVADIYVQRLDSKGVVSPGWPLNGLPVCLAGGAQSNISIASDGANGAFIAWQDPRDGDDDVYMLRIRKDGTPAPGWPADGLRFGPTAGNQQTPVLAADRVGNVFLLWSDSRSGSYDIYALHVDQDGVVMSRAGRVPPQLDAPPQGYLVCGASGDQKAPQVLFDNADGAIAVWEDSRGGASRDIYGQRVDPSGHADASWTPNGVVLSDPAAGDDVSPRLADDGGRGAIVVWSLVGEGKARAQHLSDGGYADWGVSGMPVASFVTTGGATPVVSDGAGGVFVAFRGGTSLYGQRLTSSGLVASGWPVSGKLLAVGGISVAAVGNLVADGTGGVYIPFWATDLYVVRVTASGARAAGWGTDGVSPAAWNGAQKVATMVGDGEGGVIVAWEDYRGITGLPGETGRDIWAQRLLPSGLLGMYAGSLDAVTDVPLDQGGWVRLSLTAPTADADLDTPYVTGYDVWRLVPASAEATALRAEPDSDPRAWVARASQGPVVLRAAQAAAAGFPSGTWASLGFHPTTQSASYLLDAPTRDDSTAAGTASETYLVTIHTTVPVQYVVTSAVAGHSTDNIPPAAPQALAGEMTGAGMADLSWSANGEGDLAGYSVYRGSDALFVPSPSNRVGTPATSAFHDAGFSPGVFYKVAARDRHGNESPYAMLAPAQVTGVEGGAVTLDFLAPPAPNPFSASSLVTFGLARAAHARVTVHDLAGRRVRTLLDGESAAGNHPLRWNGEDDGGRPLPPGLYLVRLELAGAEMVRRVARIQ